MTEEPASTSRARDVLARHRDALMALPGVVGTALGLHDGEPCIQVLVGQGGAAYERAFPDRIEDVPVSVVPTGPIRALDEDTPG